MIRIRLLERLHHYLDQGMTHVPVREMLDLLDPRYVPPEQQPADPRADPITGCYPVTADGLPPGL